MEKRIIDEIENIKRQIGKNELNSSLKELKRLIEDHPSLSIYHDQIIMIENQKSRFHSNMLKGILTSEQISVQYNRITDSLLKSIEEIKRSNSLVPSTKREDNLEIEPKNDKKGDRDEKWKNLSRIKQLELAKKGSIQLDLPSEDFQLYFEIKYGELINRESLQSQLHYIELQKIKAENNKNPDESLRLYSIVCGLYEELESLAAGYIQFQKREESFVKWIKSMFRNDKVRYNLDNLKKINNLKNKSHIFYNEKEKEIYELRRLEYEKKELYNNIAKLRNIIVKHNKEFDNVIIGIPGVNCNYLCDGFLWYHNMFTNDYTKWHKDKFMWIEKGDPVLSKHNNKIISPFNGLIVDKPPGLGLDYLWLMIPEKGTDLSSYNSIFVFGEIIDAVYKGIDSRKKFTKYADANFELVLDNLRNEKLAIVEPNEKLASMLIESGLRN